MEAKADAKSGTKADAKKGKTRGKKGKKSKQGQVAQPCRRANIVIESCGHI